MTWNLVSKARFGLFYVVFVTIILEKVNASTFVREATGRPRSTSVFSLCTQGRGQKGRSTMNILTYASQVSISPPFWGISLYKGTQSHANMMSDKVGVLALLPEKFNLDAVKVLGNESGKDVDKEARLRHLGVPVEKVEVEGAGALTVPSEASQLIVLRVDESKPVVDVGDHDFFMCSPVAYYASSSQYSALTTRHLREFGII